MPEPSEILASLARIADDAFGLAVIWHIVAITLAALVLAGWRPARREAGVLIAAPIATAAALAWTSRNPFNGVVLSALAIVLAVRALQAPAGRIAAPVRGATVIGALMIAFALIYPHFLDGRGALAYLYGAPVGLIPCPTLALAVGATLVAGSPTGRAAALALAAVAVFYGVFGALRLGVWIDLALIAGAFALIGFAHHARVRPAAAHPLRPAHALR